MADFEIGEVIVCSITVKDSAGTLTSPATSMQVSVKDMAGASILAATDMTEDSTGTYHYDWATASRSAGTYVIRYTATDGARITIQDVKVNLVL